MVNTFLKPGQASWDSSFKASFIGVMVYGCIKCCAAEVANE